MRAEIAELKSKLAAIAKTSSDTDMCLVLEQKLSMRLERSPTTRSVLSWICSQTEKCSSV
jgi:hypothetical protein